MHSTVNGSVEPWMMWASILGALLTVCLLLGIFYRGMRAVVNVELAIKEWPQLRSDLDTHIRENERTNTGIQNSLQRIEGRFEALSAASPRIEGRIEGQDKRLNDMSSRMSEDSREIRQLIELKHQEVKDERHGLADTVNYHGLCIALIAEKHGIALPSNAAKRASR